MMISKYPKLNMASTLSQRCFHDIYLFAFPASLREFDFCFN